MRTAPFALGSLVQLRVQADQVIGSGTGVTQDDLPALLANLAVVLVVGLVPVAILCWVRVRTQSSWLSTPQRRPGCGQRDIGLDLLLFFLRPLLLFFLAAAPRASASREAL